MKVRIVKTDFGYTPQVHTKEYGETTWHTIGNIGSHITIYSHPEYVYDHCVYLTQWGAKRVLNKWLKENVSKTVRLEKLKQQLENPNVVYEAEV